MRRFPRVLGASVFLSFWGSPMDCERVWKPGIDELETQRDGGIGAAFVRNQTIRIWNRRKLECRVKS
jgi:hypothetical protein